MSRIRSLIAHNRPAAMMLMALALAMRVLLPGGIMPASDGEHGISVQLCDGSGIARHLNLPTAPKSADANAHPCAFSVLAFAANLGEPVLPVLPVAAVTAPLLSETLVRFVFAPVERSLPPSHAPPAAI